MGLLHQRSQLKHPGRYIRNMSCGIQGGMDRCSNDRLSELGRWSTLPDQDILAKTGRRSIPFLGNRRADSSRTRPPWPVIPLQKRGPKWSCYFKNLGLLPEVRLPVRKHIRTTPILENSHSLIYIYIWYNQRYTWVKSRNINLCPK